MSDKRRHIILINKTFQLKLIGKFILVNILILILFGIIIFIFLNSEIDSNLKSAHVEFRNIKDMLFPVVITLSLLNIIVSSFIIGIFVLYASHKIAGPMYRFNEILRDISSGKLDTVTSIRDGDQLYECSDACKHLTEVLSADISKIKTGLADLKKIVENGEDKESAAARIGIMEEIISRYKV